VQAITDNAPGGCTPEEIAGDEIFPSIPVDVMRRILAYAGASQIDTSETEKQLRSHIQQRKRLPTARIAGKRHQRTWGR